MDPERVITRTVHGKRFVSLTKKDGHLWPKVIRRVTTDQDTGEVIDDDKDVQHKSYAELYRELPEGVTNTMVKFLLQASLKALTMWQLSIRLPEGEARALAAAGDAPLLEELSRRVRHWRKCSPFPPAFAARRLKESSHFSKRSCRADAPVPDLLQRTQDLWAAPLCDAPPPPPPAKGATSLITLVGDAAHPMVSTDRMFLFCFSLPFGLLK